MKKSNELRSCVPIGTATAQQSRDERNSKRNRERNDGRNPYSLAKFLRNRECNLTATAGCAPLQEPPDQAQRMLNRFVRLVNSFAVQHGRLLHQQQILAELDQADRETLLTTPLHERQEWAELLAYRLCNERVK